MGVCDLYMCVHIMYVLARKCGLAVRLRINFETELGLISNRGFETIALCVLEMLGRLRRPNWLERPLVSGPY